MSEQIKFTKEELEEITTTKEVTFRAQIDLGKITFYKHELEQELDIINQEILKKMNDVKEAMYAENKVNETLTAKYGSGSIDIVTGNFIKD